MSELIEISTYLNLQDVSCDEQKNEQRSYNQENKAIVMQ